MLQSHIKLQIKKIHNETSNVFKRQLNSKIFALNAHFPLKSKFLRKVVHCIILSLLQRAEQGNQARKYPFERKRENKNLRLQCQHTENEVPVDIGVE